MSDNISGVVKWFNTTKGFGFISTESYGDVFVHYQDIKSEGFRNLKEGQKVSFELENGAKGARAREVTLLQDPA